MNNSHTIPKNLLKAGAKLSYTTNGGNSHTVYVSKKPICADRSVYKVLNVWNNSRCGRYVYDRYTVII